MGEYEVQDKLDTAGVISSISGMLEEEGFRAFEEFTAVDTRQIRSCAAFISVEKIRLEDMGRRFGAGEARVSQELTVRIRLMGRICGYGDYREFSDRCQGFCAAVVGWGSNKRITAELGKTTRCEQQKRLEREVVLNIGLCMKEAVE